MKSLYYHFRVDILQSDYTFFVVFFVFCFLVTIIAYNSRCSALTCRNYPLFCKSLVWWVGIGKGEGMGMGMGMCA